MDPRITQCEAAKKGGVRCENPNPPYTVRIGVTNYRVCGPHRDQHGRGNMKPFTRGTPLADTLAADQADERKFHQKDLAEMAKSAGPVARAYMDKEPPVEREESNYHIVSFTGHRPNKLGGYNPNPWWSAIQEQMYEALVTIRRNSAQTLGVVWGGALGVDQGAAALALGLEIPHCLVAPFKQMDSKWPEEARKHFRELASTTDNDLAEEVILRYQGRLNLTMASHELGVVLCYNDNVYTPKRMMDRNIVMVDVADEVIAVWNGSEGGTSNCVGYARNQRKQLTIINPNDHKS